MDKVIVVVTPLQVIVVLVRVLVQAVVEQVVLEEILRTSLALDKAEQVQIIITQQAQILHTQVVVQAQRAGQAQLQLEVEVWEGLVRQVQVGRVQLILEVAAVVH